MHRSRTAPSAPSCLSVARTSREETADQTSRDMFRSRTRDRRRGSWTGRSRERALTSCPRPRDCARRPRCSATSVPRRPTRRFQSACGSPWAAELYRILSGKLHETAAVVRVKTFAFLMIAAALVAAGCNRIRSHSNASETRTETIAPANAQPAQNGTDAMTQTTEVEDSRSEGEGGVSTSTATTKSTAHAGPKAPAKKKRK